MKYSDYLKSDHWKTLRAKKTKHRCAICRAAGALETHHVVYRNLYDVTTSDLRKLCAECHRVLHELLKSGDLVYKNDNANSRFTLAKAAVKKARFGNPTIHWKDIRKTEQPRE